MDKSFLRRLSESVRDNWSRPAFSDYMGRTYTYSDFAERIVRIRLLLEASRVRPGDKVAIIGRNSAGWAMDFFSILSYGCVAVPILHDFKPSSVQHIIRHSGAKALFVANSIWENLDPSRMEDLDIILRIDDLHILHAKRKKLHVEGLADAIYSRQHPYVLRFEDVRFHQDSPDELAVISYTSGTSGFSKGVMVPYRALWSNMKFGMDHLDVLRPGADIVSILPMAHMYGLAFEVYTEVCLGCHIHFLTRNPSPRVIGETFKTCAPVLIVAVPLVLEKIVKKSIFPLLQTAKFKLLSHIPLLRERLYSIIRRKLEKALGDNFYEVIIGGAAFNPEVERFLRRIQFRYTVGYGMTECAPLISYADWRDFKEGSVGRAIERMQVRIDSADACNVPGEIQVHGDNVMLGYYNDESATRNAFTEDGWLRTGDLGTIDSEGNIYIRGRSKNMLLGPSGQNIYPEEIEGALNARPYISESLVVSRDDKLVALIHPELEKMDSEGITSEQLTQILRHDIAEVNKELPAYCRISTFQIYQDEFEKTPKRSIKRFLYQ